MPPLFSQFLREGSIVIFLHKSQKSHLPKVTDLQEAKTKEVNPRQVAFPHEAHSWFSCPEYTYAQQL